jgi:hypothetical protein
MTTARKLVAALALFPRGDLVKPCVLWGAFVIACGACADAPPRFSPIPRARVATSALHGRPEWFEPVCGAALCGDGRRTTCERQQDDQFGPDDRPLPYVAAFTESCDGADLDGKTCADFTAISVASIDFDGRLRAPPEIFAREPPHGGAWLARVRP